MKNTVLKSLCIAGIVVVVCAAVGTVRNLVASTFDGQYHIILKGEISQNGTVIEEYETDNDFTVKGHRLYYGLVADKSHRVGRIYYTGKNKARITVSYFGQGKEIFRAKRESDGSWAGKFHGYFLGEEGERYTNKGTVSAEPINE